MNDIFSTIGLKQPPIYFELKVEIELLKESRQISHD